MIVTLNDALIELIEFLKTIKKNSVWLLEETYLFENGICLFQKFCKAGCQATRDHINQFNEYNSSDIQTLASQAAQLIADNKYWILVFLCEYTDTIIIDPQYFEIEDQLTVRSGIQFMFDLFCGIEISSGIYTNIDEIFDYLKPQIIDSIDENNKLATQVDYYLEIPFGIPVTHHWWFNFELVQTSL